MWNRPNRIEWNWNWQNGIDPMSGLGCFAGVYQICAWSWSWASCLAKDIYWMIDVYGHFCAQGRLNGPIDLQRRSERRNNLQICPRWDPNMGGSDLWSNMLPLDHGGAPDIYWKAVEGSHLWLPYFYQFHTVLFRGLGTGDTALLMCMILFQHLGKFLLKFSRCIWFGIFPSSSPESTSSGLTVDPTNL